MGFEVSTLAGCALVLAPDCFLADSSGAGLLDSVDLEVVVVVLLLGLSFLEVAGALTGLSFFFWRRFRF